VWVPAVGILSTKANAIAPLITPPQDMKSNSLGLRVLLLKQVLKA
jgi:hypothetical protein